MTLQIKWHTPDPVFSVTLAVSGAVHLPNLLPLRGLRRPSRPPTLSGCNSFIYKNLKNIRIGPKAADIALTTFRARGTLAPDLMK